MRFILLLTTLCLAQMNAMSQVTGSTGIPAEYITPLHSDVLSFMHDSIPGTSRVDVYVAVPFEALQFQEYQSLYMAKYRCRLLFRDTVGRPYLDTTITRSLQVSDYRVSRGLEGSVHYVLQTFVLKPGPYKVEVSIADIFSRRTAQVQSSINVPNYEKERPLLSSLILAHRIEQTNDVYRISPLVGRRIRDDSQPHFIVFEAYPASWPQRVVFRWRITNTLGDEITGGTKSAVLPDERNQLYIPFKLLEKPRSGVYKLVLEMIEDDPSNQNPTTLASNSLELFIPRTSATDGVKDLAMAIRQLRYVATQEQLSHILEGTTDLEKQVRFDEFWKELDPTPGTAANEAFEEYYQRIEKANLLYRSTMEGWMTDRGMVYVINGTPINVERFQSAEGRSTFERWMYPNRIIVTFEDTMGFGDFRLRGPLPTGGKYRYRSQ